MQQSVTGVPAVTANGTTTVSNVKQQQSSMDHTNIPRSNNALKDVVDGMHFTSSHQPTVTTTAAQVITVIAPSTQSTDMISSQPVVVQVSGGNEFITVEVPSENDPTVSQPTITSDDPDDAQHATFEDYNSVYSNGSNSAGQMTYYTADSYPQTYYNPGTVNLADTYVVMEQAANNDTNLASNCITHHRDSNQNIILDEEYNKNFQQNRMSVQPQTMNWLMENYENADGVSLPRSTLYSHYQQHCTQNNIEPVNAASFGKLIRSVFVGLRTRRLGTRGNSKYHYYGIRIKPGSSLARISDNSNGIVESSTMPPVKRAKMNNVSNTKSTSSDVQHVLPTPTSSSPETLAAYLGDASLLLDSIWPSDQIPDEHDEMQKVLNTFSKMYRAHYEKIIRALSSLNFHEVENIWNSFWQCSTESNGTDSDYLDIDCIRELVKSNCSNWIEQMDYLMYNAVISNLLLPNLLKPIPQLLTQQIRNFAKCINKWMMNALHGYDEEFIRMKATAVSALSHMLRRYTSLNHLSSAALAVLKNPQQVNQMISDLNKVDFKNVQEQASWVCQCDDELIRRVENSFKTFLQDGNPYDRWASWCEEVLDMCLPDDNIASAKQFFFKWEFYSSLVMRDLTLRSAASFGSFHLIRLLYDEYIFYLIEQRIAKATETTPLQMLGGSRLVTVNASQLIVPASTVTTVATTIHSNNLNKLNQINQIN